MADRGRGRRGGSGGRGQQPPVSGRGRGAPAPVLSPATSPFQPVASLTRDVERKLHIGESSSSEQPLAVAPSRVVNPETDNPHELAPASNKAVRLPARPGYGKFGRKTVVKANHFLVSIADRDLSHYDVSISPEVSSKKVCREIVKQLVICFRASHLGNRQLAYDGGKSVYTAGELPFVSKEFVVKLPEKDGSRKERDFKVTLKFASKADLHHLQQFLKGGQLDVPQETLQFLDVVLREKPSNVYTVVGRSFFHPSLGRAGELGNGLEYWKGFYQSLRPTQMGLSLNVDISARAFLEPIYTSVYVMKYLNKEIRGPLSDQDRLKVKKTLKGIRVEVNHQKNIRRYKISDISKEPIQQLMFTADASGARISVVEYFRQTYNISLKYPMLPAIQAGSDSKPIYLPMELCQIVPGQRYMKKLNDRQVTEMLRATCQRPKDRQDSIQKMVDANAYNADRLVNAEFGIKVSPELTSIEARVLPPPALKYHESGREARIEPRVGQWNMINKKMVNGGRVDGWTGVCFSRNVDASRFCNELIGMCKEKGMEFNPRPLIPIRSNPPNQIDKVLRGIAADSAREGRKLQLLIVILPDVTGSYDIIKKVCETELGIVSQCCQPRQAGKYNKQYMENVALKINVKVGGTNSILELARVNGHPFLCDRPTIVFGADVTHPSPGEDSSPSIAAVVASVDWPQVSTYRALVSSQGHREEIIQDLYKLNEDTEKGRSASGMIRDHLIHFYKRTNRKPDRIIFYRDGVSEGQFSQVLLHEVDAIRKACTSIQETYLPRITFVVVQKRHHTRLFPVNHGDRNSTDKSGNILPGTIVDTTICHPNEFDFYLCSHAGIQGTSRPTHYHVLYDENNFTADAMQILTNNLCYTYARCTRSVSIVPPAYYAHLAAARARCYVVDQVNQSDSGSTAGRGAPGGATRGRNVKVEKLPAIAENVQAVMFYC